MTNPVGDYARITRLIKAPRPKVYDAWLNPDIRRKWWHASPEMHCDLCEIDPRVGGSYRLGMRGKKQQYIVTGKFLELIPPQKIVFTWNWETSALGKDSRVTIDLFETQFDGQPATEIVLLHEGLTSPQDRSEHTHGWVGCLVSLNTLFSPTPTPSPGECQP